MKFALNVRFGLLDVLSVKLAVFALVLVMLTSCCFRKGAPEPRLPARPVSKFTVTPSSGAVPLWTYFTNQSTGSRLSMKIDYGDGSTVGIVGSRWSHKYNTANNFVATLTVRDRYGRSSASSQTIMVTNAPPVTPVSAAFTVYPTNGTGSLLAYFTNWSTGPYTDMLMNYDDGSVERVASDYWSHSYGAGNFSPRLTVWNTTSTNQSSTVPVTVSSGIVTLTLAWNHTTPPMKYGVYVATSSGGYSATANYFTTNNTQQVTGLIAGTKYFFSVDATDPSGRVSSKAPEINYTP